MEALLQKMHTHLGEIASPPSGKILGAFLLKAPALNKGQRENREENSSVRNIAGKVAVL